MIAPADVARTRGALEDAGFLAPDLEAAQLALAAAGDPASLDALVERRIAGEPLAWVTGSTTFCGETIRVDPGVYVPRPQTEALAEAATALLPPGGVAVDLCTGSGAIAAVLARRRPTARVIGTDIDPAAIGCARANGVEVYEADLAELPTGLPAEVVGRTDVVVAVVPYVPTEALHLLPRDVQAHEPRLALDGGAHGTALLDRAAEAAAEVLRPGGWLLLELGGDQDEHATATLHALGFVRVTTDHDADGDLRMIRAQRPDDR